MYNPKKPSLTSLVLFFALLVSIGFIINQSNKINLLTMRMDRIESEEKDINQIVEEYEEVIENIHDVLTYHDRTVTMIMERYEILEENTNELEKLLGRLEKENEELIERLKAQQLQIVGLWANGTIEISPELVEPRKEGFMIGDTMAINIESSYPAEGSIIRVWFPNSTLVWESEPLLDWFYHDGVFVPPYYTQISEGNPMVFYENYPQGNYTYAVSYLDIWEETGEFEVIEAWEGVKSTGPTD